MVEEEPGCGRAVSQSCGGQSGECVGLDVVLGSDSLRYFNGWRVECVAAGRSPRIRSSVTSSGPVCFTK